MKMRNLGRSGLKVSELCMGTMTFGGEGRFGEVGKIGLKEAKKLVDIAIDGGVNFFDTADVYSSGTSEKILGGALGKKRKDAVICTKVHFNMDGQVPNKHGGSRYHIMDACNDSLKHLNTDYIDVYMLHTIDTSTPFDESLRALDDLVRWGKVRYIGCSNYSAWHLMKALSVSDKLNLERFVTFQGHYSLLSRDLEYEHVPLCLDQGVGIMVWSPLSGGFLAGKYSRGGPVPKNSRVQYIKTTDFIPPFDREKGFDMIEELKKIAKARNRSTAQVALNYLINKPAISSIVMGINTKKQLKDNLETIEWKLTEAEMEYLDKFSAPPDHYPYRHQRENK